MFRQNHTLPPTLTQVLLLPELQTRVDDVTPCPSYACLQVASGFSFDKCDASNRETRIQVLLRPGDAGYSQCSSAGK